MGLETLQKLFRSFQFWEKSLFFLKRLGMDTAAAPIQPHGMLEVQHFVINEIFDGTLWHFGAIEHATNHDGVVRRIVVPEALPGRVSAPRHKRPGKKAMKKAPIEIFKDCFQIVVAPLRRQQHLSSPLLTQQMSFSGNIAASQIPAITRGVSRFDFFTVQLRQKDVSDGMKHVARSAGQQVRNAYENFAVSQSNGVVDVGKREELDVKFRHRSPWPQLTILVGKDFSEFRDHLLRI